LLGIDSSKEYPDPLGRPVMEGTIYDPTTTKPAPNGQLVRDPFLNNMISRDRMDSVALKVQALIPVPSIKMGPGDSARSHSADEYILVKEIEAGIEQYIQFLQKLKP
jgi:acetylornithine deacetylase